MVQFVQLSSTLVLIASPFVGSFIGCVADRVPPGRALVFARSRCDHCDHPLGIRDLVPLFSWLIGAGKCRYCSQHISLYYPLVEIGAFAIAVSAMGVLDGALVWMTIGLGWILLTLAAMDLRHMILANSLNLLLLGSGLIV